MGQLLPLMLPAQAVCLLRLWKWLSLTAQLPSCDACSHRDEAWDHFTSVLVNVHVQHVLPGVVDSSEQGNGS